MSCGWKKEIWKNGTKGHGRMFASAKWSDKSRLDSLSLRNSVLIISHITFRDCRVHIFPNNLSIKKESLSQII